MYSDFRIVKKAMKGGVYYIIEGMPLVSEHHPIAWEVYEQSPPAYLETIEDARKAKDHAMNAIVLSKEVVE
jgi:hypothetical protein